MFFKHVLYVAQQRFIPAALASQRRSLRNLHRSREKFRVKRETRGGKIQLYLIDPLQRGGGGGAVGVLSAGGFMIEVSCNV